MDAHQLIARFRGRVSCRCDDGSLGLTLMGRTTDVPDEIATLTFTAPAPADLPDSLQDVIVEQLATDRYRIRSGRQEWCFPARAAHLHRDVSTAFYEAVAARRVPWKKRLFWRIVLAMARSGAGRKMLLALRRR